MTAPVDLTLTAIDRAIGSEPDCATCGRPLAGSVSDDFCSETCQAAWRVNQVGPVPEAPFHSELDQADPVAMRWHAFLTRWQTNLFNSCLVSVRQLRQSAQPGSDSAPLWAGTFPSTVAARPLPARQLVRLLDKQVDRWRGDLVLRRWNDGPITRYRYYWVQAGDQR